MPLRDHFHPPLSEEASSQEFHGMWPGIIVQRLNRILPKGYAARPRVQLGKLFEIDVAAYASSRAAAKAPKADRNGGARASVLAPPKPDWRGKTALPEQYVYEVRIYDERWRTVVAAIEIVSPGNKDRPETREAFISKCVSLLDQGVCVSIVDLVTLRSANLYAEIIRRIRCGDPFGSKAPPLYAVTCRLRTAPTKNDDRELERWSHPLKVGQPLPTLPIWLNEEKFVSLDLEASYEETLRDLRME